MLSAGAYCLLLVDWCCLLFTVLLFVVRRALFGVRGSLFVGCCSVLIVRRCLLFVVCCVLRVDVRRSLFVVCCLLFPD